MLTFDIYIDLKPEFLNKYCDPQELLKRAAFAEEVSHCNETGMELQLGNISLADWAELSLYRARMLCLREQDGSDMDDYCALSHKRYVHGPLRKVYAGLSAINPAG